MDLADGEENEVLDAVFSFIDGWEERSNEISTAPHSAIESQPWLTPLVEDEFGAKRGKSRRELPKQELLRLREEVPALKNQLKMLQSARARYEAANCEASRVIALAAAELRRGEPEAANGRSVLVWKEMAMKYERLRKEAEQENIILREHIAHQLRTIESLQNLKATLHPRNVSFGLVFSRSTTTSNTEASNTLIHLSSLLATQFSEIAQVFRPGDMPSTLSDVNAEMVSPTQMNLEVLHSSYLPAHFHIATKAFWKNCQSCQGQHAFNPHEHEDTLVASFAASYQGNDLTFALNGYSTMRKHEDFKQSVIVSSSRYHFVMLLNKSDPGVQYSENGWVVLEPAHDNSSELCILRVCARIELNVDNDLSDRERIMELLSEMLIEQKQQELEAVRLGIEGQLLRAT